MKQLENRTPYHLDELCRLAQRENNKKRGYLLVNPKQGKHIPVSPGEALDLFERLAQTVKASIGTEPTAVIGFAETATAIGAAVAASLGNDTFYLHTTREHLPGHEPLVNFSETHSHAVEQVLYCEDPARLASAKRLILAEDEITTGNTILNLVRTLRKRRLLHPQVQITALSVINSMSAENCAVFASEHLDCRYLLKLQGKFEDAVFPEKTQADTEYSPQHTEFRDLPIPEHCNPRLGVSIGSYRKSCADIAKKVSAAVQKQLEQNKVEGRDILLLGTEECMYPALFTGAYLEKMLPQSRILCHATTRSPICPAVSEGYPLFNRVRLSSVYEADRTTFLYNLRQYGCAVLLTDTPLSRPDGLSDLTGALSSFGNTEFLPFRMTEQPLPAKKESTMRSSYHAEDVTVLLKDVTGQIEPLDTKTRERLIQSGVHYSEMLPLEYEPTAAYRRLYEESLANHAGTTALAVGTTAEKIWKAKRQNPVLVSLARAGIPVGILIKRYLERKYHIPVPHYTISIIRGRGIDQNAMAYLLARHRPETLQFVDGWIGKGAITRELKAAVSVYPGVSPALAVLADPAGITPLCGTREDFLIPSACLNSTVSGLLSRTIRNDKLTGKADFDGAVYYTELESQDISNDFLEQVEQHMRSVENFDGNDEFTPNAGLLEAKKIAEEFHVADLNLVKPGIGETTRVLLRRVPHLILVRDKTETAYIGHILRLCEEKNVEVVEYPLACYRACGLIRDLSADV